MSNQHTTLTQLHLGLGAFHRAHQAAYLQQLQGQSDQKWQISAGDIRPSHPELIDQLTKQQGRYVLESVDPLGNKKYQAIESIKQVIPWDANLSGLIKVAAAPDTRIISFTVTEAGYYLDQHGDLDLSFDDLTADLCGNSYCTIYGALSHLLEERVASQAGSITLLSCDNLRGNGYNFAKGFRQFLTQQDKLDLLAWVENFCSTPNSMVDRITPRPTPDICDRVFKATGIVDKTAVMCEQYTQWVIEDKFVNDRPAWDKVGVEFVKDVAPHEEAKIRLLNATHSCIAWAGVLAGYTYIHESVANPKIRKLAYDYATDDVIPCLVGPENTGTIDFGLYRNTVLERFSNPYIEDTNLRVTMDSFSKVPGFILPTIIDTIEAERPFDSTAVVLALFLVFLQKRHAGKLDFDYQDQNLDEAAVADICDAHDPVLAYVSNIHLFGPCAGNPTLLNVLRGALQKVQKLDFSDNIPPELEQRG